jgi:hypothetical protein
MNSSYFSVPGRGGASDGKPPAHCGITSLNPEARYPLIVPHPQSPLAMNATAAKTASW